jgi:hypothetical protein
MFEQETNFKIFYKLANEEDFMGNLSELNGYKKTIKLLGEDYTYIETATNIHPYSQWGGKVEIFKSTTNNREVKFIQSIDEQDNIIENYYIFVGVVGDNGNEFDLLAEALILPKTNITVEDIEKEKNKIKSRNMTLWKLAINNMHLEDINEIKTSELQLQTEVINALNIRQTYLKNKEENNEENNKTYSENNNDYLKNNKTYLENNNNEEQERNIRSNSFKDQFWKLCDNLSTCFKKKKHKGGKRRTRRRRQRSNKKRTNKRKKTKTRMKRRKTSKRNTNNRRRKR